MAREEEEKTRDRKKEEAEKLVEWRLGQLIDSGYGYDHAMELAKLPNHEVEIGHARSLVEDRGCDPDTAYKILKPVAA